GGHRLRLPEPLTGLLQLHRDSIIRRAQRQVHILFEELDRIERVVRKRGGRSEGCGRGREHGDRRHREGETHATISDEGWNAQCAPLRQYGLKLEPEGGNRGG